MENLKLSLPRQKKIKITDCDIPDDVSRVQNRVQRCIRLIIIAKFRKQWVFTLAKPVGVLTFIELRPN